jgi:hypothetical protein
MRNCSSVFTTTEHKQKTKDERRSQYQNCGVSHIANIYENKQLITMKTKTAPVVLHADSTPYQKTNEKCKLWTLSVP